MDKLICAGIIRSFAICGWLCSNWDICVKGKIKMVISLKVIGMNAITAYVLLFVINFSRSRTSLLFGIGSNFTTELIWNDRYNRRFWPALFTILSVYVIQNKRLLKSKFHFQLEVEHLRKRSPIQHRAQFFGLLMALSSRFGQGYFGY